jgi:hypothetical protein
MGLSTLSIVPAFFFPFSDPPVYIKKDAENSEGAKKKKEKRL